MTHNRPESVTISKISRTLLPVFRGLALAIAMPPRIGAALCRAQLRDCKDAEQSRKTAGNVSSEWHRFIEFGFGVHPLPM
jgi:hypothetical protein